MTHNSDDHLRRLLATVKQLLPISIEGISEAEEHGANESWLEYALDSDIKRATQDYSQATHIWGFTPLMMRQVCRGLAA